MKPELGYCGHSRDRRSFGNNVLRLMLSCGRKSLHWTTGRIFDRKLLLLLDLKRLIEVVRMMKMMARTDGDTWLKRRRSLKHNMSVAMLVRKKQQQYYVTAIGKREKLYNVIETIDKQEDSVPLHRWLIHLRCERSPLRRRWLRLQQKRPRCYHPRGHLQRRLGHYLFLQHRRPLQGRARRC